MVEARHLSPDPRPASSPGERHSDQLPDAKLLAAVLDALPTAVLVKDVTSARYIFANAGGASLLARSHGDVVGRTDEELDCDDLEQTNRVSQDQPPTYDPFDTGCRAAPPMLAFRVQQRLIKPAEFPTCSVLIGEDVTQSLCIAPAAYRL